MTSIIENEKAVTDNQKLEPNMARLSVNLPLSIMEELKDLSKNEGISVTEIVRRALSAEKFLRCQVDEGNKLLVLEKGQTKPSRVVVFR